MGCKILLKIPVPVAVVLLASYGQVAVGQQRKDQPALQRGTTSGILSGRALGHAIELSTGYVNRACGSTGKFTYSVDMDSGRLSLSYNIVRHAGAMYALAMANRFHKNRNVVDAMTRAAGFLLTNYVGLDRHSNMLVIWSDPSSQSGEAELGASGLGLVALSEVEQARPNTVPREQLRGLGRFVLFLQKSDGSFTSKYRADSGPVDNWDSLYYPGEAALGLVALYELDHSHEWLVAAGKALAYLAQRRATTRELAPDHWALIATAKFLPYYEQSACPASRADLVAHAARICEGFLREQVTDLSDPSRDGGFDAAGRTTPAATRLEGLLAALEFLPSGPTILRAQIRTAVDRGVGFLLRAQIVSGPYAGGMPLAVDSVDSSRGDNPREVRIDYVQHALCAWLRYEGLFLAKER